MSGPRSASDPIACVRMSSAAFVNSSASLVSPRMIASDASCSRLWWKGVTSVSREVPGMRC